MGGRMNIKKFSMYDVEALIKEAGAERVTEDAVLTLENELERILEKIGNRAFRYARHAGRKKLIKKSDILLMER